jgi:rod shape-determining protein MreC
MAVINYAGFVGRVIEAEKYTAKILLISDPGLGVSAQGQRSRQEGLVCGTLGRNLIMRYLPEKADIKAGDVIVTSGLNSAYPKGLLLGTVTEIGREFSSLSRYAAIEPAVDFSALEEVLVVVQPAPSGGQ